MHSTYEKVKREDQGATAAEYGILLAFIVIVIVVGIGAYGNALGAFIARLAVQIQGILG